jgi:DNA-directed RNA polymerase specialized sigma24 family protein
MQYPWNDPDRQSPTPDDHEASGGTPTDPIDAALDTPQASNGADERISRGAKYRPSVIDTLRVAELIHAWGEEISDPLLHVLSVVEVEEVRRIIVALPERQRTVISLRSFGGLSKDGVGALLELSVAEVAEIEAQAFEALKAHLSAEARVVGAVGL